MSNYFPFLSTWKPSTLNLHLTDHKNGSVLTRIVNLISTRQYLKTLTYKETHMSE